MYRKVLLLLISVLAAGVLAGCAEEQPQQGETPGETAAQEAAQTTTGATAPGTTAGGTTMTGATGGTTMGGTTGGGTTVIAAGDAATVGGFVVESPNAPETTIPEVSVSQADAREYLDQVRPIIEDSVQDVSGLAQPEVSIENGSLSLDLPVNSLEEARGNVQSGLDELRNIEPPQSLEPINEQLIESYERTLPAYEDIIQAANSGDVDRISDAVQENLPRIERFNAEARAILQDLEQAAGTQQ